MKTDLCLVAFMYVYMYIQNRLIHILFLFYFLNFIMFILLICEGQALNFFYIREFILI